MRYIDHDKGGTADCMRLAEGSIPVPQPGEILVQVVCAGVNRPDILQRAGQYPPPAGASPILGLEVAGRVAAVGADVTEWKVGAGVTALTPGGGYAEYCVTPACHALPIPQDMDFVMAAALPENWFTVWANLVDLGRLATGERVLVHGGSSGIGLTAIHLAKHLGAECIVTVGNDIKAQFCHDFGATHAINYRTGDFAERVKALTGGSGVDIVLDMVGAPYFQRNLGILRRDGRLVSIAFLEGSRGECDLLPIMMKRLTCTGSTMRSRTVEEKQTIRNALTAAIWPRLAAGDLLPHIFARFPLAKVAEAHQLMESGQHIGKIVLDVAA